MIKILLWHGVTEPAVCFSEPVFSLGLQTSTLAACRSLKKKNKRCYYIIIKSMGELKLEICSR